MSLQVVPPSIKELIYQNLVKAKSFKELEALKYVSKEWYYIILSLQWEKYSTHEGPKWYNSEDYVIPKDLENDIKEYEFAFYEYGRYNVKHIKFSFGYNNSSEQIYYTQCPNLKSLCLFGSTLDKEKFARFIELNPSIEDFSIEFRHANQIMFDTDLIFNLNFQKLTKTKMYGITFKIFNLSFIFDRFPNLREMYVERLDLSDVSDIIFPKNSSQLPNGFKQFPNIISFELDQISIPNIESLTSEDGDMVLGIPNLFPNLVTMKIDGDRIGPYRSFNGSNLILKSIGLPRFPLLHLSKLELTSINPEIANNLATNCPNVQELTLKTQQRSNNRPCYEVLRIFANSFPHLVRFDFQPTTFGHVELEGGFNLFDALFFDQSIGIQDLLIESNWIIEEDNDNDNDSDSERDERDESDEDEARINLSFEAPLRFNWTNLREIIIKRNCYFTPRSLLVFTQFRNLEKLRLDLVRLVTNQDIKESKIMVNDSSCFPNLFYLNVGFVKKYHCSYNECVEFINMLPALKICEVRCQYDDIEIWDEAKELSSKVVWNIKQE